MFSFGFFSRHKIAKTNTISDPVTSEFSTEIWVLILSQLEPCFLIDVMRTCSGLRSIAMSNVIFRRKLDQYFPGNERFMVNRDDDQLAYRLFSELYKHHLGALASPITRRLYSFIIENDIEQIHLFARKLIECKIAALNEYRYFPKKEELINRLSETDALGMNLLTLLNRQNNQKLRDTLYELCVEQGSIPSTYYYNRLFYLIPIHLTKTITKYEFLLLAAALNQPHHMKAYPDMESHAYDEACRMAVQHGHIGIVKVIMPKLDIASFVEKQHPLILSAKYNQIAMAKYFLEAYPAICGENIIVYAMIEAARYGNDALLALLYPRVAGIDFAEHPAASECPVYLACRHGHVKAVQFLIQHFPGLINAVNKFRALLTVAVDGKQYNILRYLCVQPAMRDPYIRDHVCPSLLEDACMDDDRECIRVLLDHYIKPNAATIRWARKNSAEMYEVLTGHNLRSKRKRADNDNLEEGVQRRHGL